MLQSIGFQNSATRAKSAASEDAGFKSNILEAEGHAHQITTVSRRSGTARDSSSISSREEGSLTGLHGMLSTTVPGASEQTEVIPDFADIRLPNQNGFVLPHVIDPGQIWPTHVAAQSIANNVIASRQENPDLSYVIIGEAHSPGADKFFRKAASALRDQGIDLVVGIETPTTPEVDNLILRYNLGHISAEEFIERAAPALHESYLAAVFRRPDPLANPDGLLTREYWETRLRDDVVSYVEQGINVAFVDPGRFVEGANREVEMVDALLGAQERYPDSLILAQIGGLHAQPGYLPTTEDRKRGEATWNEAMMSRSSGREPAAMLLQEIVGPQAMQTYIGSEYFEFRSGAVGFTHIDERSRDIDFGTLRREYEERGEEWHGGVPFDLPGMGGGGYFVYHDPDEFPEPKGRTAD